MRDIAKGLAGAGVAFCLTALHGQREGIAYKVVTEHGEEDCPHRTFDLMLCCMLILAGIPDSRLIAACMWILKLISELLYNTL